VDERIAIDGREDLFEVKVEREVVLYKSRVRPFKGQHSTVLPALDHPITNNTAPPPVFGAVPAEDLPTPKCMVK